MKALKKTSVVPLDEALGIDLLPFKMSPGFMLECAFWAQNQKSYEAAEAMIARVTGVRTNDDTIRLVVNTVGKLVFDEDFFDEDCRRVDETMEKLEKHELHFPRTRKGTLYMAVDETALKTRQKKDEGATCKVGIVFTSDNNRRATKRQMNLNTPLKRKNMCHILAIPTSSRDICSTAP